MKIHRIHLCKPIFHQQKKRNALSLSNHNLQFWTKYNQFFFEVLTLALNDIKRKTAANTKQSKFHRWEECNMKYAYIPSSLHVILLEVFIFRLSPCSFLSRGGRALGLLKEQCICKAAAGLRVHEEAWSVMDRPGVALSEQVQADHFQKLFIGTATERLTG